MARAKRTRGAPPPARSTESVHMYGTAGSKDMAGSESRVQRNCTVLHHTCKLSTPSSSLGHRSSSRLLSGAPLRSGQPPSLHASGTGQKAQRESRSPSASYDFMTRVVPTLSETPEPGAAYCQRGGATRTARSARSLREARVAAVAAGQGCERSEGASAGRVRAQGGCERRKGASAERVRAPSPPKAAPPATADASHAIRCEAL